MEKRVSKQGLAGTLICVILLGLSPFARAQEDSLETVSQNEEELILLDHIPSVFGASKYEQKITEAPSAISIVTAAEIEKYGYQNLADIMDSLRGFYRSDDRNYEYLGIRGFSRPGDYNTRVLLLIDGHRVNDNIYDTAFIGNELPLSVDLIDRVEVIRGPSSSIYGTSAFLGVINIITKKGRDIQGTEVSGEAASHNTFKGSVAFGNRFGNGLEILLSGSASDSGGENLYFQEFDSPDTNYGRAKNVDDEDDYSYFLNAAWNDLTLQGVYGSRDKTIPTAPWGVVFNDPDTMTRDARGYLNLKYEHYFLNQVDVMVQAYYDYYRYDGKYVYDYEETGDAADFTVFKDYAKGEWYGVEIKLTQTLFDAHKLTVGGEYRDNLKQDQKSYDRDPYYSYLDDSRNSENWGIYLQDEFAVIPKVILSAGLRYDHYDSFGSTLNPRLAGIYTPFEETVVKLVYGQAFRAPNVYERYYHDGATSKANPDLDPETIDTYEVIWEQYFGPHIRTSVSGYYFEIEDLIGQAMDPSDGFIVYQNRNAVESRGMEIEAEGKWPNGVEGRISYALQDAEDKDTGKSLTNSPRHLLRCNAIVPVWKDIAFAGAELKYTSDLKTLGGNEVDDFWITNMTLSFRDLLPGFRLSVSVYNLFDVTYGNPGSEEHLQDAIEQDGRNFRFKLSYGF